MLGQQLDSIYRQARTVYVGRSNYPERRLLEHWSLRQRPRLCVLTWTSEWAEAAFLERWLIRRIQRLPKGSNADTASSGRWEGAWNCVYLSWEQKTGEDASLLPSSSVVRGLDDGARLAPIREPWPGRAVHLVAGLPTDEAAEVVRALQVRRRHRAPRRH